MTACWSTMPDHEAVLVTDRAQGRVFIQVFRYVGKQDLVDDDGADHETHDGAKGKDVTDRRCCIPVVFFTLYELLFGQHQHIVRQVFRQRVTNPVCIPAFVQPDQAKLDFAALAIREQAHKIVVAGNHRAVDTKGRSHLKQSDHFDLTVIDLGHQGLARLELFGDGPEFRSRTGIKQNHILLAQ